MRTLSVSILVLAVSLIASVFMYNTYLAQGSVSQGSEYQSRYLTSTDANATTSLKTQFGTVGSVVITSAGTGGNLSFYATNTAGMQQATSSNDLLFQVDGSAAEGTYVYDAAFGPGLLIDVENGFDGEVTVTYR